MKKTPHSVQLAALNASNGHHGFNFFMEQGLGKTATAYLEALELWASGKIRYMVVICPNSFKGGWITEAADWGFDIIGHVFESGADWDNIAFLGRKKVDNRLPVLIVNHEAMRSEKTKDYVRKFAAGNPTYLANDESIQTSTHDAAQTRSVLEIAKEVLFVGGYVRNLSGKPMKAGPHDLWAQMRIIGQLESRNYFAFKSMFCRMGGFKAKKVIGAQNEDILKEIIEPYTFRATKADWTDLPPKVWGNREYTLQPEMREHYRSMMDDFIVFLEGGEYVTIEAAITKYMKLAQIQTGFIFDENQRVQWLVPPNRNTRLRSLREFYDDEVTGKLIIVYNHKPVRDLLAEEFAAEKPAWIRGGMAKEDIESEKRRFNTDKDCRVICITKAAKYGHTLLGLQNSPDDACSTMAFFENTYSLDDRSQLEDRAHRHGQLQSMMSYMDFIGTPLDHEMVLALQTKEGMFQSIFKDIRSYKL